MGVENKREIRPLATPGQRAAFAARAGLAYGKTPNPLVIQSVVQGDPNTDHYILFEGNHPDWYTVMEEEEGGQLIISEWPKNLFE